MIEVFFLSHGKSRFFTFQCRNPKTLRHVSSQSHHVTLPLDTDVKHNISMTSPSKGHPIKNRPHQQRLVHSNYTSLSPAFRTVHEPWTIHNPTHYPTQKITRTDDQPTKIESNGKDVRLEFQRDAKEIYRDVQDEISCQVSNADYYDAIEKYRQLSHAPMDLFKFTLPKKVVQLIISFCLMH